MAVEWLQSSRSEMAGVASLHTKYPSRFSTHQGVHAKRQKTLPDDCANGEHNRRQDQARLGRHDRPHAAVLLARVPVPVPPQHRRRHDLSRVPLAGRAPRVPRDPPQRAGLFAYPPDPEPRVDGERARERPAGGQAGRAADEPVQSPRAVAADAAAGLAVPGPVQLPHGIVAGGPEPPCWCCAQAGVFHVAVVRMLVM
ncbi:hypothetical protein PWT90_10836 [Aphanocladium album]|nr:hypothetical protein PWT90_10836 [Aphanocladium album]